MLLGMSSILVKADSIFETVFYLDSRNKKLKTLAIQNFRLFFLNDCNYFFFFTDECETDFKHQDIRSSFSSSLFIGTMIIITGTVSLFCSIAFLIIRWKRRQIYLTSKKIPSGLPVSPDNLPPTENGYTHVVARVHPNSQTSYISPTPFGNVVYHHNFVFDHMF
jgi:hypothetical protein